MSSKNVKEMAGQMRRGECAESFLHTSDLFLHTGAAHRLSRRETRQGAKQDPHWTSWSSNSYGRMARRTMKQRPRCTSECYTRLCRKRKVQTAHRRRMTCTMQTFMCSAKCGRTLSRWNACVQNLLRSTPPFASPRPHLSMTATMEPWCEPLEVLICMILPLWE